jgi:Trm5-related predicted tRNA methylase
MIAFGSKSWGIMLHETALKESFDNKIDWNNTYYLSPDAPEAIIDFDERTQFIIGGLIDRTVIKNASLEWAEECQLQARRLPI